MWVYFYPSNTETELQNAYIWEYVDVTSLTLDKSSISLTTVWQTNQLTATTVPAWATVTWSSSDTTIATVSNTWLVTCVTPWNCTITATSFGVTATCSVVNSCFVYSYDFRNKTIAQTQADGWVWESTSSYYIDSEWIYKNWSGYKIVSHYVDLSNASKITIVSNVYCVYDKDVATWVDVSTSNHIAPIMWSTAYNNAKLRAFDSNSVATTFFSGTTLTAWDHTITIIVDVLAKTVSFSDGDHSWTYSLTDTQTSYIVNSSAIRAAVSKSWNRFRSISITVE